ncbi:MAG: glycosyltransferase family 2 protein [Lachnospiraceae bacterium]|jgi:rhamnosyltransferase|nr:glycosyltransferase family 2 protein [Lachnospiraceae bacterium]
MEKVVILMSTYNGETFLAEQIDSIMKQDYEGVIVLLIRDDGSKDGTIDVARNYPQNEKRIIKIIEGKNIGPQKSFLSLIREAEKADYYFFSDQDDIWYDNKIKRAVSELSKMPEPACYCTNYDICNDDPRQKRTKIIKETPSFSPLKVIFYNQIPGCTMGFNNALMEELKNLDLDNVMMHDSMVLSYCSSIGKICYDEESGIIHRIHGNNVVGEGHKKIIPHRWIMEKIKLVINKDDYDLSEMARQFIRNGKIKDCYLSDLILLKDYKKSWRNTIKLLRHKDSHDKFMDRTTLSIRFKILLHVF